MPLAIGAAMIGIYFSVGMVLPLLIKVQVNVKSAVKKILAGCVLLALIVGVLPGFTFVQGGWVGFGVGLYLIFGVLLPSQYLKGISTIRYTTIMLLMLMMVGTFLKVTLRLGFNVKYVVSIPQVSLNI
jgi:hypothetical protein